ncbi:hypothetical protein [Deinococcus maricopensis]|uniref:Uncharacterized protein n=1 Tax=Deinococcus maricopensis (strain DSM 21211 / LMG 22137 / NRRL B-23946 / LB-34) TaxID=709986 RepID=E8U5Q8_DEIML|nr:hypothetical protein [Deinococcus maricopensis]ADV66397.1 hypothetical protein Deima_0741 [Deinococcus maricopensis DSM 21211]
MRPTLEWEGYHVTLEEHSRLTVHDDFVAPRQEVRCTFYLTQERFRTVTDYRRFPFYSINAPTAEEAEERAHLVFLRARNCRHQFVRKMGRTYECTLCGVLYVNDAPPAAPQPDEAPRDGGMLGKLRSMLKRRMVLAPVLKP